ncbi:MAG: hypothetical protein FJX72_11365, partial [Armatimonadetes bacterium]|nr:hypothetical protein [Armatimonadota bacterium]
MRAHTWLVAAALLAATSSGASAQRTVQFESLEPTRCSEGTTGEVNVVEAGFSAPGKIGGDRAIHWFGMENEGALLEYEIPVGAAGRYRLTLGLVKSWDYGLYKVSVNGKPVGGQVDLASKAGEEKVLPFKVDLGIHELSREHVLLSIEFVGESPNAIDGPNPRSCGLDYIMLTPATGGTTGGGTTTTGGTTAVVGKASTVQLESLEPVKCTEGGAGEMHMVEAGFARDGEFGADRIVHWAGMENPGATLEYRVPLAVSGRYRVTLGVAKSWDYGLYEFAINGKSAGGRADLASKAEPEKVFPLKVDLG